MKYYIILSTVISGVGGSMIYQLNKLRYYKRKGYTVCLFQFESSHAQIKIKGLETYRNNYCEAFNIHPSLLPAKRLKQVINFIKNHIDYNSQGDLIIESDGQKTFYWGEYLANELKGKHVIYILGENQTISDRFMFSFCYFKLKRKEFFSITKTNTQYFFSRWIKIPLIEAPFLKAYCTNCLDCSNYHSSVPKSDFVIGSIGRLDKPCLKNILSQILCFTSHYQDVTFTILLIGGSSNPITLNYIDNVFKSSSNVKLHVTGNLYPIPIKLVKMADVYLSQAGSVNVSKKLGIPTIRYSIKDQLPISIENFYDQPKNETESNSSLNVQELLKDVLFVKKYPKLDIYYDLDKENNIDFSEHDYAISESSNEKQYFDIFKYKDWMRRFLYRTLICFIGESNYLRLRSWKNNI